MSFRQNNTDSLICRCYGVTESQLTQAAITVGISTIEEVVAETCAGGGCTACHFRIQRVLARVAASHSEAELELAGACVSSMTVSAAAGG